MVRALTFDRFDAGIDLRKGMAVTDANRMRDLVNCDVTTGMAVAKRPGLHYVKAFSALTVGLYAFGNYLYTFDPYIAPTPDELKAVVIVGGFPYLAVTHWENDGLGNQYPALSHYWLNHGQTSTATRVTDANCPSSEMIVALNGKVYTPSIDGAAVRFSATNNPLDWTTPDDAGFLPISHHGGGKVTALAVYRGRLAVFTDTHVQIWAVDPDPALHRLEDVAYGVGTNAPLSITPVSGDVLFLGFAGVRSLSQQAASGNLSDVDIGSPVDDLVQAMLARHPGKVVRGHYSQALGKFLLFVAHEVLVYSFSRSSKLAAWSRWTLPAEVKGVADMNGKTYLRMANQLFWLDPDLLTDNGVAFTCYVELGFMALKMPGSLKRLLGMDAVVEGECDFWVGFDERNSARETVPFVLDGDSRPLGTIPLELHGTAFSPRLRCQHDKPFRLDLLTFYYDAMGVR